MIPKSLPAQAAAPFDSTVEVQAHFHTDQIVTVAGGHFIHDSFTAFLAPLLPLIQDKLGIGYASAGGLAIFSQLPSLLTPFIGYLADRISLRYLVILAPAGTATLMSLMGLAPSYLALAFLLLAVGVSVAAFHAPAPAMIARVSGEHVGTGMSVFMASGELGRTVGPIVVVAGVTWWGLDGIWRLATVGWITSALLYWRLHSAAARPAAQRQLALQQMWPEARRVFPVLTWILVAKAFMAVAITTYLPIFMRDQLQTSLWLAAAALTILEGAGVVGALSTGTLSDRFGRIHVLLFLFITAPLFLALFLFGPIWSIVPALIALGLTAISPTPVLMAIVQDQFPEHRAVANGLFMFANFLSRAGALWAIGLVADSYGLVIAFVCAGVLALGGIPAVFLLPNRSSVGNRP
jgi:FSR family fosmidomycin resistance protein-like MFS transporter